MINPKQTKKDGRIMNQTLTFTCILQQLKNIHYEFLLNNGNIIIRNTLNYTKHP